MTEAAPTTETTEAPKAAETDDLTKVWQEYLQKCCEVGQIRYQLDQIEGQQREIEKNLEVTERAVKSAAAKHRELQKKQAQALKPKVEEKTEATH